MRFFIDAEFQEGVDEDGRGFIWPISIAIVAENGNEMVVEFEGFDWSQADPWLVENVKPYLRGKPMPRYLIADWITQFVAANSPEPEFWGYVVSYDWVVLMQVFGGLMKRPLGWPTYAHDLKELFERRGLTKRDMPGQVGDLHDPLEDARWNLAAYNAVYG